MRELVEGVAIKNKTLLALSTSFEPVERSSSFDMVCVNGDFDRVIMMAKFSKSGCGLPASLLLCSFITKSTRSRSSK